ncbi:hypothetical protein GCM10010916_42610 [Paenibacillus abyssi]|uniref:Uncharacterized protein n=1 Tax=Paenibacillus abyssi TaxID=1340531 RepID=A0A917G3S4_9BACL|nr:hypothetical protein GCM10010916_42610 [Paenibacillus abyssi]
MELTQTVKLVNSINKWIKCRKITQTRRKLLLLSHLCTNLSTYPVFNVDKVSKSTVDNDFKIYEVGDIIFNN